MNTAPMPKASKPGVLEVSASSRHNRNTGPTCTRAGPPTRILEDQLGAPDWLAGRLQGAKGRVRVREPPSVFRVVARATRQEVA
jgi:hypothetical protein